MGFGGQEISQRLSNLGEQSTETNQHNRIRWRRELGLICISAIGCNATVTVTHWGRHCWAR